MRHFYIFLSTILLGVSWSQAQSNLGLESWTANDPDDWSTLNIAMQLGLPQTTFQEDTDPPEGNYYARVLSTAYTNCAACPIVNLPTDGELPGLLNQDFEVVNQIPVSFSFSVKYESGAGGDNGVVLARAFNWDPVAEERVFIAVAVFLIEQNITDWEQHTVDFDVPSTPDSIELIVGASAGGIGVPGAPPLESGSQIWVDDFSFVFDDITCPEPTAMIISDISTEDATIVWTAGDEEEEWEVLWGLEDFDPTDETQYLGLDTTDITSYNFTGLTLETTYDVYVRALCSENDQSDWVKISFTTPESCPSPNDVTVADITINGALVAWAAGGEEDSWDVIWGEGGFDPAIAAEQLGNEEVTVTSITLSDLEDDTTYDVYVRAVCSNDDQSDWVKVTFTTELDDASLFTNQMQVVALYPNPAKDHFTVSLSSQDDFTLTMIDAQGRIVKTQSAVKNGSTIATEGLTEGFYFVKLSNGITTLSGKVVLK